MKMENMHDNSELRQKKKKKRYDQRYRAQWEKFPSLRGWLTDVPGEPLKAYCKACKDKLSATKYDLVKHGNSKKHDSNWLIYSKQQQKRNESEEDMYSYEYASTEEVIVDCSNETSPQKYRPKEYSRAEEASNSLKLEYDEEKREACLCHSKNELIAFSRYIGLELLNSTNPLAVQKAKLEINKILYNLAVGSYDMPQHNIN